jgi:hypothetical protein
MYELIFEQSIKFETPDVKTMDKLLDYLSDDSKYLKELLDKEEYFVVYDHYKNAINLKLGYDEYDILYLKKESDTIFVVETEVKNEPKFDFFIYNSFFRKNNIKIYGIAENCNHDIFQSYSIDPGDNKAKVRIHDSEDTFDIMEYMDLADIDDVWERLERLCPSSETIVRYYIDKNYEICDLTNTGLFNDVYNRTVKDLDIDHLSLLALMLAKESLADFTVDEVNKMIDKTSLQNLKIVLFNEKFDLLGQYVNLYEYPISDKIFDILMDEPVIDRQELLKLYLNNFENIYGLEKAIEKTTEIYNINEKKYEDDISLLLEYLPERYLNKRLLMEKKLRN